MGQQTWCESDANDPKMAYDNTKPIVSTPPRASRRSQRNIAQSPKYSETNLQPNLSQYVKEKLRQIQKYEVRNSSRVKGEARPYVRIKSSETIYRGQWKDNEPLGVGELFFKDGPYYFGTFAHGYGRYIFSQGSFYEGQVRHNVAEGKGKLINDSQSYSYSGEWLNDLPNGRRIGLERPELLQRRFFKWGKDFAQQFNEHRRVRLKDKPNLETLQSNNLLIIAFLSQIIVMICCSNPISLIFVVLRIIIASLFERRLFNSFEIHVLLPCFAQAYFWS